MFKGKNWAEFKGFNITDEDLSIVVKKHMKFFDRFELEKVVAASQYVFTDMSNNGGKDPYPEKMRFKFTKKRSCL